MIKITELYKQSTGSELNGFTIWYESNGEAHSCFLGSIGLDETEVIPTYRISEDDLTFLTKIAEKHIQKPIEIQRLLSTINPRDLHRPEMIHFKNYFKSNLRPIKFIG